MRLVSSSAIVLRPLPQWPGGAQTKHFSQAEVVKAIQRQAPAATVPLSDRTYIEVPASLVDPLIAWTRQAMRSLNFGYVPESRDCDKFAKAFSLVTECCAADAGIKAQPLCARIHIRAILPWAGVKAGGGHALCAIRTTSQILVIEPQNGQKCPLEAYPNRGFIFRVMIGG